jgi:ankyrin repeat protein
MSHTNKALLVASEMGQVEKVKQLITANADVEARDEVTGTNMHTRYAHAPVNNAHIIDHEDEQTRAEVLTCMRVGARR